MKFDTVYIDGDWLIYNIAYICEDNYIEVKDLDNNFIDTYTNVTTFKGTLSKDKLLNYKDLFLIEQKKKLKDGNQYSKAVFSIKAKIRSILKETNATKAIIALGGDSNFRNELLLPVKYKGNRKDIQKPLMHPIIRKWVEDNCEIEIAQNEEADDIISKRQYEGYLNKKIIVCTEDKDARGTPGYLYNPNSKKIIFIDGLGKHELIQKTNKNVLYGTGRCWEYLQILMGDKVDFYHPQDLLTKTSIQNKRSNLKKSVSKLSDTKLYECTKNFTTDKQWFQFIHDMYYTWYKDLEWYYTWDDYKVEDIDYLDLLQTYWLCVHMRRWDNDAPNIVDTLKKQNIL